MFSGRKSVTANILDSGWLGSSIKRTVQYYNIVCFNFKQFRLTRLCRWVSVWASNCTLFYLRPFLFELLSVLFLQIASANHFEALLRHQTKKTVTRASEKRKIGSDLGRRTASTTYHLSHPLYVTFVVWTPLTHYIHSPYALDATQYVQWLTQ